MNGHGNGHMESSVDLYPLPRSQSRVAGGNYAPVPVPVPCLPSGGTMLGENFLFLSIYYLQKLRNARGFCSCHWPSCSCFYRLHVLYFVPWSFWIPTNQDVLLQVFHDSFIDSRIPLLSYYKWIGWLIFHLGLDWHTLFVICTLRRAISRQRKN